MYVCLFDIDGTLLLSGGAGKAAMEAALHSTFGVPADSGGVPYSGRTDPAIGRDLFKHHNIEATPANWERFLRAYLGHLPDCLSRHTGRVLPGIKALLDQLRKHDRVVLGLLTGNVEAGARLKLGHFGLFDYFAFGGFGDLHHHRDDVAREAWQLIEQRFKGLIRQDRVWVIGDTPHDVQCARAIGARVAAVATGWHPVDELGRCSPDLLLPDFSDPTPLLERLGA